MQPEYIVPVLDIVGEIPRIEPAVLHDVLEGRYDASWSDLWVLDARNRYEFAAGHIKGALNVLTPEDVRDLLFVKVFPRSAIVVHCELSVNRGPTIARILREIDRSINHSRYPTVHYPQVFILDGGFKEYFKLFPGDCDGIYRPLLARRFVNSGAMAREMSERRDSLDRFQKWKHNPILPIFTKWSMAIGRARRMRKKGTDQPKMIVTRILMEKSHWDGFRMRKTASFDSRSDGQPGCTEMVSALMNRNGENVDLRLEASSYFMSPYPPSLFHPA
jgi:M-phase inducer tyrosine phosphatase